jgi:hypothetical protein
MEYFAALPGDQLAAELESRIEAYYNWVLTSGRLSRWRIAYDTYYGQRGGHNASFVTPAGKQGELSFLMADEYRNLVQHLLVLAFQSRTSLETVSTNTDSTSKSQTYVAKGLVEYYRRDGLVDQNIYEATEISLIMDSGWVFNEWDTMLGQEVAGDPETGQVVRQGDLKSRARTPLDVIIDFTKPQGNQRDWVLVRDPVNKFDLGTQYKEMYDDITALERDYTRDALFRFGDVFRYDSGFSSPDIDVWTFFHRKSPALPQGRMFQFATRNTLLFDGPIPYRKLPGNRVCPTEQILSAFGYSNCNTLLGLQDVMDAVISAGVTNMTTAGVNNIWVKDPAEFDFEQLVQGMNLLSGGGGEKPEVLIMNRLSPEWIPFVNFIIGRLEAYSGVNSVARGDTGGKDLSGAAMALLQSMAIQYNNGLVKAKNKLTEDCGNDIIQLTQDYVPAKRTGMIIGQNNQYMVKDYSGSDLNQIQRVYCRESNPMKDTTAGKVQLLDLYKELGLIKSAAQVTEILETGQLDSSTEPGRNLKLAIDQENEALINGEVPPVMFTDNHPAHFLSHSTVFASPESRKDLGLIERMKAHLTEHLSVWMQYTAQAPEILIALGIPLFQGPPPPQMPGIGAPPGAPQGPGGPPQSPGPDGQGGTPPPSDGTTKVPGPNFPKNPLSGQQWNPQTGGMPEGAGNG